MTKRTTKETFRIKGEKLLEKINQLAREGNVRKVTIKNKGGKEVVSFPMTVGVAATVIAPILATIGLVAFFLTECTVEVERIK